MIAVTLEQEDHSAKDSEVLNEEQEQWFKRRMKTITWARPYKPCPEVVIGLKWIER